MTTQARPPATERPARTRSRTASLRLCLAVVCALSAACEDAATEVLVRVRAEEGLQLESITLRARFADDSEDEVTLPASALPFTVPVGKQGEGNALQLSVLAEGSGGEVRLEHEAHVRFFEGRTLLHDVELSARCANGGGCGKNETCERCGCRPVERKLPAVNGSTVAANAEFRACVGDGPDGGTDDDGGGSAGPNANDGGPNDGGTHDGEPNDGAPSDGPPMDGAPEDGDTPDANADSGPSDDPCKRRACVRALSLGDGHACFVTQSGELYCWGEGADGQLGRGELEPGRYPVARAGSASDWQRVSVSPLQTCGTRSAGDAYCWGDVLGAFDLRVPTRATNSDAEHALQAGAYWACGIQNDGSAECWGAYPGVPFGDVLPLAAPPDGGVWDRLADSTTYVYLIDDSDNLWSFIEQELALERSGVLQAVRNGASCDLLTSGALRCGGRNDVGQAGLGSSSATVAEGQVQVQGVRFTQIAGSATATCALDQTGSVWCWGDNSHGAMGPGAVGESVVNAPVQVGAAPADDPYARVEVGGDAVCALRDSGLVDCWGGAAPVVFGAEGAPLRLPGQ